MISHIKLIGSLVYKTRQALNTDSSFMQSVRDYRFSEECMIDGKLQLWHLPGTPNELFEWMVAVSKKGNNKRFPAILNFQPVKQEYGDRTIFHYNLAIIAPTKKEWTTGVREEEVFNLILRPIYRELLNQINLSGYVVTDFGKVSHSIHEVYTTGNKIDELIKGRFDSHVDAIEIQDLTLTLRDMCYKHKNKIEEENRLVTEKL